MKTFSEMPDGEKAEFVKQLDAALRPLYQFLEEDLLEGLQRWLELVMTEIWNAISPPLDWLFNEQNKAE
jgi:hypothetical protein